MAAQSDGSISRAERVLAIFLTPFVVAWDLFRKLVFGFFSVMERLDPFAAIGRLLKRFGPWASRLWAAILPKLQRLQEFTNAVARAFLRFVGPIVRRISPVLQGTWRLMVRVAKPVLVVVRSSAREVRRAVSPALRTVSRLWRVVATPFRRVTAMVRQRMRLVIDRASLIGRTRN